MICDWCGYYVVAAGWRTVLVLPSGASPEHDEATRDDVCGACMVKVRVLRQAPE